MVRGWHVDSNLAKRMWLFRGETLSLEGMVRGYHCDHTRNLTAHHSTPQRPNDFGLFVFELTDPTAPNDPTWGLNDEVIPEVDLNRRRSMDLPDVLGEIGIGGDPVGRSDFTSQGDRRKADFNHALPWILDPIIASPEVRRVGYLGPKLPLVLQQSLDRLDRELVDLSDSEPPAHANLDCLIVDFAVDGMGLCNNFDDEPIEIRQEVASIMLRFATFVQAETLSRPVTSIRYIVHNAVHNEFDWLVSRIIVTPGAQFNTRVRHGFAVPISLGRKQRLSRRVQRRALRVLDFFASFYKKFRKTSTAPMPVESRSLPIRIVWRLRGSLETRAVAIGDGASSVIWWARSRR
jgi:hypothetical protein